MTQISRRKALSALGAMGGTALFAGCGQRGTPGAAVAAGPSPPAGGSSAAPSEGAESAAIAPPSPHWDYHRLDPAEVAKRAYRIYAEGGCMYAVVGGVIGALADQVGEPFRSFPIEMMRYGDGGVGAWGSLCGVVNGGSALIGLFRNKKPKPDRERLISELCVWYETTSLPQYEPAKPQWADEAEASVAGSLLCHVSVTRWCEESSCEAFSMEKKERCRRLAADGARFVVELLNREFGGNPAAGELTPEVRACVDCHSKKKLEDVMVRMNCATCHEFEDKHYD